MKLRHGQLMRGLTPEAVNKKDEPIVVENAKFGRMFPKLPAASYGGSRDEVFKKLGKLAAKMINAFDAPKDAPDTEESGIPALFTYFGQFVDHDLTFDPQSSFQKLKDPNAVEDFRTPAFDLDNVYGRGPGDQPYLYDEDGKSFLMGTPLTLGHPGIHDLQRNAAGRALIGDPRNDENAIVSQLQGLFLRFHNRVVAENPSMEFELVQSRVRHHYQYVVLHDFLPRIVSAKVLDALKTNGKFDKAKLKFFRPPKIPFMPVEFSVAAYRFGHSMVRPGYRLNPATLVPIFPNPPGADLEFPEGLTGFRQMISDWGIDWGKFIDLDVRDYGDIESRLPTMANMKRLQFAYKIDTSLVDPLGNLPESVAANRPNSLAHRNLLRGVQLGLPNGQEVANAMGVTPLDDKEIKIGQAVGSLHKLPDIVAVDRVFKENCPLWTYILAEAMYNQVEVPVPVTGGKKIPTPQLGPVGGRIVAEVILGLMYSDPSSYLHHDSKWVPEAGPHFGLKDFVKYALGD